MIILVIRKSDNDYFSKKSEPYLVWKLASPGSVVPNRLCKLQLGRLPELNDIE